MALSPVSADELEQRARERADMVESQFCTSAEVQRYLEAAWQELYSVMVASSEDFFIRHVPVANAAGQAYLELPIQVKAFRLARHQDGGTRLRKATLQDLEVVLGDGTSRSKPLFYRFDMDPQNTFLRMALYPPPDKVYVIDLYFIPALSLQEFVSSSFVSIPVRSWDEFIALRAAAKMKDKEESDISSIMKEAEMVLERIKADLIPFDRSEPDVVAQINNSGFDRESLMLLDGGELFS